MHYITIILFLIIPNIVYYLKGVKGSKRTEIDTSPDEESEEGGEEEEEEEEDEEEEEEGDNEEEMDEEYVVDEEDEDDFVPMKVTRPKTTQKKPQTIRNIVAKYALAKGEGSKNKPPTIQEPIMVKTKKVPSATAPNPLYADKKQNADPSIFPNIDETVDAISPLSSDSDAIQTQIENLNKRRALKQARKAERKKKLEELQQLAERAKAQTEIPKPTPSSE